jgi:hypothetical protein
MFTAQMTVLYQTYVQTLIKHAFLLNCYELFMSLTTRHTALKCVRDVSIYEFTIIKKMADVDFTIMLPNLNWL